MAIAIVAKVPDQGGTGISSPATRENAVRSQRTAGPKRRRRRRKRRPPLWPEARVVLLREARTGRPSELQSGQDIC